MNSNFKRIVSKYVPIFMKDFNVSLEDASAVFGNLAYECVGFEIYQEIKPIIPGSRGGWGWAMWTGPRRKSFEAYCKRNNLDLSSDRANYGWLFTELTTTSEKKALPAVTHAVGLNNKVIAFEKAFLRAHANHKNYTQRQVWARRVYDFMKDTPIVEKPVAEKKPQRSIFDIIFEIIRKLVGMKS